MLNQPDILPTSSENTIKNKKKKDEQQSARICQEQIMSNQSNFFL